MGWMLRFLMVAVAVAGVGCQAASLITGKLQEPVRPEVSENLVWPKPPDPARVRFVRSISAPEDVGIERSFFGRIADAVAGRNQARFVRPTGVAEHEDAIYVADPGAQAVWIFDPHNQASIEIRQAGNDTFLSPVAVAASPDGRVFVADSVLAKVFLFERNGKFVRQVSGDGLERPVALAYDEARDRLYVADAAGQQIVVYASDGKRLLAWGGRGVKDGQFNFPSYLGLLDSQTVVVTDALNYRVQAFDPDGRFLWKIGHQGDGSGDFAAPKGVAGDNEGHLYVVDALFETVQIFDRDGTLLLSFGQRGTAAGEFWLPNGAFIDGRDRIYVADSYNQRVQVFEFLGGSEPSRPIQDQKG